MRLIAPVPLWKCLHVSFTLNENQCSHGGLHTQDKHQTHLHHVTHTHTHNHVFIFKWDKALKLWVDEYERTSVVVLCFWGWNLLSVSFKHKKDIQQQKAIVPNACSVSIYIFSHETINNTKDDETKLHVSKGKTCCACVYIAF